MASRNVNKRAKVQTSARQGAMYRFSQRMLMSRSRGSAPEPYVTSRTLRYQTARVSYQNSDLVCRAMTCACVISISAWRRCEPLRKEEM